MSMSGCQADNEGCERAMTEPSLTPLTDAKVKDIGIDSPFVCAEFARALERQLSEANAKIQQSKEWEKRNPMGGAAAMLEAMAERVRAGEPFHEVLEDFKLCSVEKLERIAATGTADSFMSLSDEQKRQWFATTLIADKEKTAMLRAAEEREAEARQKAIEECIALAKKYEPTERHPSVTYASDEMRALLKEKP